MSAERVPPRAGILQDGHSQGAVYVARALTTAAAHFGGSLRRVPLRGRGRVAEAVHRRLWRYAKGETCVHLNRGDDLLLPMTSSQSWRALMTGGYDDEVISFLSQFITPGSLVVDIGASLGLYTIPLARAAARVGGEVLAVEPLKRNVDFVRTNVQRNGLDNSVTILNCVVAARAGTVELRGEPGGAGNAAVIEGHEDEIGREEAEWGRFQRRVHVETAEAMRLDDVLTGFTRPVSLVKMDVEGFEFEALSGADRMITLHRPVIYAEMSPQWLTVRGVPDGALDDWLKVHVYRCLEVATERTGFWSDRRRVTVRELTRGNERRSGDLLLAPSELPLV